MRDMPGAPRVALCTPPVINVPWQFVETFRFYDVGERDFRNKRLCRRVSQRHLEGKCDSRRHSSAMSFSENDGNKL